MKDPRDFDTDLDFLERCTPDEISMMHNSFKNVGRQTVQTTKKAKNIGVWRPCVGSYDPQLELTRFNDQEKLLTINPIPDPKTMKFVKKNKKR